MSDLILSKEQLENFNLLNTIVESTLVNTGRLSIDSIIGEAVFINACESSIPERTNFNLHFDMILSGTIPDYYRDLNYGNNHILEAARKIFPNSVEITESIDTLKSHLKSLLNEDLMSLANPIEQVSNSEIGMALSGGELKPRPTNGFMETLTKLWKAATEGGSPIGMLQFVLDIIGAFGDMIFPGVGVVADIINAIIYFVRGKYMLAAISVIAAVVMGGGDVLKLQKVAAEMASPIFVKLAKGNVDDAAKAVQQLGAKDGGMVMRFLRKLVSMIGGAVGSATSKLGSFVKAFGNITKYIPGLGLLLKPLFEFLGKTLTNFGTSMTLFCDSFKLMDSKLAKESIEQIISLPKGSTTFKLSDDGKMLFAFDSVGTKVARIPAEKFASSGISKIFYGATNPNILFTTAETFAKYQAGIAKLAKNTPSLTSRFGSWISRTLPNYFSKKFIKGIGFFVGKQIWKLIHGEEWSPTKKGAWSEAEVRGHGNAAFNAWISDQLAKKRAETGAVYAPYIDLDSSDKETYDKVLAYQNSLAEKYGEPKVMNVVTKNLESDKVNNEFAKFFKSIESGNVTRGGKYDRADHTVVDRVAKDLGRQTSESFNFKFTPTNKINFSK
jgi:hypothetical protein